MADRLESSETVTLSSGEHSIDHDPRRRPSSKSPSSAKFPRMAPFELELEFELEWDEDADEGGELEIG